MTTVQSVLMIEFLAWLTERPRTYRDVMEAWRSTCPRHSVWEDAVTEGLVKIENGGKSIVLTALGARLLRGAADART
jgi:hypothetical protein